MQIILRDITSTDFEAYAYWQLPIHAYHRLNGPYFKKADEAEIAAQMQTIRQRIEAGEEAPIPQKKLISNAREELLGEVNWYWKSEETHWLEIGIVIFDENNWGKGIGRQALKLWINEVFYVQKSIVRIGLTTWSGNAGMMKLAEKLGMKKEAEYRQARIVDGQYYDSVSYGILKSEWELIGANDNVE